MSTLIKRVAVNGKETDVFIEGNQIAEIGEISCRAEYKIDGKGKLLLPGFFNSHTHAAMTLFRGWGDDMALQPWLEKKIWPAEARLTEEAVYWGAKLACLEMVKSGTTFFNDMYWHGKATTRAAEEAGMRATISSVFLDFGGDAEKQKRLTEELIEEKHSERIQFCLGPHAIYSVSEESLGWIADFARERRLRVHIHLSETKKEVEDCLRKHRKRPVEYLESIGLAGPHVIAAHATWLDAKEIGLVRRSGTFLVHCPVSNMKLAVGGKFPYQFLKKENVLLGTDGPASNNSLDMFNTMKTAALLQKYLWNDPTLLPAAEAVAVATANGARAFGIKAGRIEKGWLADLMLVDLKNPAMTPAHNLESNIVYSASGPLVDTLICDGKILMEGRKVKGEEKILEEAAKVAADMVN